MPATSPSLIVLRGNSGAGKSTLAEAIRARSAAPVVLVEQDYLRRTVLDEPGDAAGADTAALIEQVARFGLAGGRVVLVEGILDKARYGGMLARLAAANPGRTCAVYLDIPLDETLRRHAGRVEAEAFSSEDMRDWYHPRDVLGWPDKLVLDDAMNFENCLERIGRLTDLARQGRRLGSADVGIGTVS